MDFDLSEEQQQIRDVAQQFCDKEVAPRAADLDRREAFPDELMDELFAVGFLGAPVPEEYGGMGTDYLSYGLIVEELGRTDASIRSLVSVNVGLVALSVLRWGTDAQRAEWVARLTCEGLGALGLTEPVAGCETSSLRSTARRD
ncbi:MAG: acyl-CoA dehydrogenase family protein, partial [Actinobacteria bacterium]|nr:acyl-CoA dehydrogenase family protein [Actinomycetota bacterium]